MNDVYDPGAGQRHALIELYDTARPEGYGYLASRCGSGPVAEDHAAISSASTTSAPTGVRSASSLQ